MVGVVLEFFLDPKINRVGFRARFSNLCLYRGERVVDVGEVVEGIRKVLEG